MKNLLMIGGIAAMILFAVPSNAQTVEDVLSNDSLRKNVMDSIASKDQLSQEMRSTLMNHNACGNSSMHPGSMMNGNRMGRSNRMMGNHMRGSTHSVGSDSTQTGMMNGTGMGQSSMMMGNHMRGTMYPVEGDSTQTSMIAMCNMMMNNPDMMKMMHNHMMQGAGSMMPHHGIMMNDQDTMRHDQDPGVNRSRGF